MRGNQRGSCAAHVRSARCPEGNLRAFGKRAHVDPQDKLISDLKLSIREKIAEIEERERGSMAA